MNYSKSALALAIASSVSAGAWATVTATEKVYTAEKVSDLVAAKTVAVASAGDASYKTSLSGAVFSGREAIQLTYSSPISGTFSAPDTIGINYGGKNSVTATNATFSFIGQSADDKSLTYLRNADSSSSPAPVGSAPGTIALATIAPQFAVSGLADTTLTVSILTGINGATLESASGSVLTIAGSQLKSGSMNFGAVIDVEAVKKKFDQGASASTTSTTFDLEIDTSALTAAAGTELLEASIASVGFVITGDNFSWLDAVTTDVDTVALDIAATYLSINGSKNALSRLTATTIEGSLDYFDGFTGAVTLTNKGGLEIPTQSAFDVDFVAHTLNGGKISVPGTVTGSWVLNGSSIDIYAVPNTSSASVFMWLTNTGTGSVPVDVTLYDGAQTCTMESVGVSVAGTEFDLSKAIADNIPTQCPTYVASGNRIRYNVAASAPAATIRVSAAYRVGTDRVNLLTSSETN
jgi:hypothetical protein